MRISIFLRLSSSQDKHSDKATYVECADDGRDPRFPDHGYLVRREETSKSNREAGDQPETRTNLVAAHNAILLQLPMAGLGLGHGHNALRASGQYLIVFRQNCGVRERAAETGLKGS